ncbi:MAG: hypothetical protein V1733_10370 [bacterium]
MAQLNIYVVPSGKRLRKTVDLAVDTVDGLITKLENANEIPPPSPDAGGNVTIWKMTRGGHRANALGNCTPDPGCIDGETVYLFTVPA